MQCAIWFAVSPAGKDRNGAFKVGSNQFPAHLEDKQVCEIAPSVNFEL